MNTMDRQLAGHLHAIVDDVHASAPPTTTLLELGRRARRRHTFSFVTASCAAVALGAAGIVAVTVDGPAPTRPAAVGPAATAGEDSPALQLAAAVRATGGQSYAFTIALVATARQGATLNETEQALRQKMTRTPHQGDGAFDPATSTGVLRIAQSSGKPVEERMVNGERFIGVAGVKWKKQAGRFDSLTMSGLGEDPVGFAVDPTQLLDALRKAGSVTQRSANVYAFEIKIPAGAASPGDAPAPSGETVTGTVTVGASSKRVEKVTYREPFYATGDTPNLFADVTVTFAGFGAPVEVERPASYVD